MRAPVFPRRFLDVFPANSHSVAGRCFTFTRGLCLSVRNAVSTVLLASLAVLGFTGCPDDTAGIEARTLVSISLTPSSVSVAKGAQQAFTALATYSDESQDDVTATASWS